MQQSKRKPKSARCIYDKNIEIRENHFSEIPKAWIQSRDLQEYLYKNGVYYLHAIPTIYLLDQDKKIILKDVLHVELIEKELIK